MLTDEQLEKFMEIIQRDSIWCDFFYTELTTGLRRGEICGLKWEDFDETHGTLKIRRTIHEEKGGKLTAGIPRLPLEPVPSICCPAPQFYSGNAKRLL